MKNCSSMTSPGTLRTNNIHPHSTLSFSSASFSRSSVAAKSRIGLRVDHAELLLQGSSIDFTNVFISNTVSAASVGDTLSYSAIAASIRGDGMLKNVRVSVRTPPAPSMCVQCCTLHAKIIYIFHFTEQSMPCTYFRDKENPTGKYCAQVRVY